MANTREIIQKFHQQVNRKRRDIEYDFSILKNGSLNDADVELLCDGLKNISKQPELKVNLSGNPIGEKAVRAIIGWIRSGFISSHVELRMKNIDITHAERNALQQAVKQAASVSHIDLSVDTPRPGN